MKAGCKASFNLFINGATPQHARNEATPQPPWRRCYEVSTNAVKAQVFCTDLYWDSDNAAGRVELY